MTDKHLQQEYLIASGLQVTTTEPAVIDNMGTKNAYWALGPFRKGKDPGETLEKFDSYVKHAALVFTTADADTDAKKNSILQVWGSDNMMLR